MQQQQQENQKETAEIGAANDQACTTAALLKEKEKRQQRRGFAPSANCRLYIAPDASLASTNLASRSGILLFVILATLLANLDETFPFIHTVNGA